MEPNVFLPENSVQFYSVFHVLRSHLFPDTTIHARLVTPVGSPLARNSDQNEATRAAALAQDALNFFGTLFQL
jgi:hypothetical protein